MRQSEWEALQHTFVSHQECFSSQKDYVETLSKIDARTDNLEKGQEMIITDIKDIKTIVLRQEAKREFIRGCLSLFKTLPKSAKALITVFLSLLAALGVSVGVYALG